MCIRDRWYQEFKTELQQEFDLSSSADSDVFLGITIDRLRDGAIKISQQRYVDDIVASFLGDGDKVSKVPYVVSWKLSKDMGPQTTKEKKAMEEIPYRRLIGMLLHLANCTRPDISAAVGILGKFNANPGMKHWKAALEVVKYLKGTANYGVVYGRQRDGIPYVPLCGYSDASWADDPDDRTFIPRGHNAMELGRTHRVAVIQAKEPSPVFVRGGVHGRQFLHAVGGMGQPTLQGVWLRGSGDLRQQRGCNRAGDGRPSTCRNL